MPDTSLDQLASYVPSRPDVVAPEYVSPGKLLRVLKRRGWLAAAIAVVLTIPAALVIVELPAYYDAQSTVMVTTGDARFADNGARTPMPLDSVALRTQADIIRSPAIAADVVQRLDLTNNPWVAAELAHQPLKQRLMGMLGLSRPAAVPTPEQRVQAAADFLQKHVAIANDGRSSVIGITVRTGVGALSSDTANAYAASYLAFNRGLKMAAIGRANGVLDEQIKPIRERLQDAQQKVEEFRARNGMVQYRGVGGNGTTLADQQISQVNDQLGVANNTVLQRDSQLRAARAAVAAGDAAGVASIVNSPVIERLRAQESTLSARVASLSATALPQNPELRAAQAALVETRHRLQSAMSSVIASLQGEASSARATRDALAHNLQGLKGQVTDQSKAGITLSQLESTANATRTLYQDYLGRYEQTSSLGALQQPDADLVAAAQPPLDATGPGRSKLIAMCFVVFLVVGLVLVLLSERFRGGMRSGEQLEAATGLSVLGFLPAVRNAREMLGTEGQKPSLYRNCVAFTRGTLARNPMLPRGKVMLVTSAVPGEGKTSFTMSMAASIGQAGGRALVVTLQDLPQSLAKAVAQNGAVVPAHVGHGMLAERLGLLHEAMPGVDLVNLAKSGKAALSAAELRDFLVESQRSYDAVLVDGPSVLTLATAEPLVRAVDEVVMVVRWGSTSARVVSCAAQLLGNYGVHIRGAVLVGAKLEEVAPAESVHAELYSHYRNAKA